MFAILQFGWCYIAKVVYSQKKCYIAVTQGSRWVVATVQPEGRGQAQSRVPARPLRQAAQSRTATAAAARRPAYAAPPVGVHLEPWVMLYSLHGCYIAFTLL